MKNLSKVLVLVLVLSLFVNISLAKAEVVDNPNIEYVQKLVERTNSSIEKDIERAQASSETIMTLFGNNRMSKFVVDILIDSLVNITNLKAKATIKISAQLGVEVICIYEEYFVGYRYVYIDPLYVMAD